MHVPRRPFSRRQLLHVLGLGAASVVVVACGGAPAPTPTTAPAAKPAEASKPAAAATAAQPAAKPATPAKLRWATLSAEGSPYLEIPKTVARDFSAANPGVEINVEPVAGDYGRPKLAADLAAGTLADVFFSHSGLIQILADAGVTKSMDEFFKLAAGNELKKSDFYPAMIAVGSTAKGETHLLGMGADAHTIHYNKQMLADAGLQPPKDDWQWADLLDYARKLTKKSADGRTVDVWGFGASNIWISWAVGPTYSAGGDWIKVEGDTQTFPSTTPEFIQGMEYLWQGVKEGVFASNDDLTAMTDYHSAFVNGKLAMCDGARWSAPQLRKATFDWDVVPIPRDVRYGVGSGTAGWAIGAPTKFPEVAWRLIQYIFSEEGYKHWVSDYAVVPSLLKFKDSPIWRQLPGPPHNNDAYVTAIKYAYLRPRGVAYEDGGFVDKQLEDAYQRYVKGNTPMAEAMKIMKEKFDPFLKENPATVVEWNPGREF